MTRYVLAFAFDYMGDVLLIRKIKPEFMRGKLNGIGGKIEDGETPEQAMAREFMEECGIVTDAHDWEDDCFAKMVAPDAEIFCFARCLISVGQREFRTTTDEQVDLFCRATVKNNTPMENLCWLLPMAWEFAHYPGLRWDPITIQL